MGAALRREVGEEVGITDLQIKNFIAEPPGAKEGDIVLLFYCTTAQDPQLLEPEKFSEWKWVELKEYLHNNLYSIMNPGAYKAACDYLTKHALNA